MPRPGGGSLGHSKHRQAFGSKYHKSAWAIKALERMVNRRLDDAAEIKRRKAPKMYASMRELLRGV